MFYSQDYYRATEEAARILTENGVSSFPLNPVRLASHSGIKVISYQTFSDLTDLGMTQLLSLSGDGFSIRQGGQYFIVYNPAARPRSRRRWTLLHEYCHIRLGHVNAEKTLLPSYSSKRYLEAAADELTSCLIAPLPIVFLCRIETEAELAQCFGLSGQAAANTFANYQRYRRSDMPPELGYGQSLDAFRRFCMEYVWKKEQGLQHQRYSAVNIFKERGLIG